MKGFKEFSDWCNKRAQDGYWGMETALVCSQICSVVYSAPFWKRKKVWQELELAAYRIMSAQNEKIKEILGREKANEVI